MTLLLLHALATWTLVGLIWFVQVVHYPLFAAVPVSASPAYAALHQRRTTWVVVPPMLVEAGAAAALLVAAPPTVDPRLATLGAALLAAIWASTFLVQVPLHRRLLEGHEPALVRRLVATNLVRTALWTARGGIALLLVAQGCEA